MLFLSKKIKEKKKWKSVDFYKKSRFGSNFDISVRFFCLKPNRRHLIYMYIYI